MPDQIPTPPWPFGLLTPGSYRMWSSGDGWGDAVITEGGRLLVRQLELDGTDSDDWHDMTGIYRSGIGWEFERVAPHPSMPVPAEASARVAELEAQRDRVTNLFEAWAAEENEHRLAGEHGLAEGLHVAIEELRMAVHGTYEPSYPPGDEPTHPRTPKDNR